MRRLMGIAPEATAPLVAGSDNGEPVKGDVARAAGETDLQVRVVAARARSRRMGAWVAGQQALVTLPVWTWGLPVLFAPS